MKYRPEIDGLRSLAIIPVILFHSGVALFAGGYIGVDVFFVISGYLITSIIAGELEDSRFSYSGFYYRRAKRILPALFVVIAVTLPFSFFWMLPEQHESYLDSLVYVSLFVSNFLFWKERLFRVFRRRKTVATHMELGSGRAILFALSTFNCWAVALW